MSDMLDKEIKDTSVDQTKIKFTTDVNNLYADDQVKHGSDKFPVFDVDKEDFYRNMRQDRKRLRFKGETKASQYMQKTKYKRPFYVRFKDEDGKAYMRKIK